jgi:hypothetical protein
MPEDNMATEYIHLLIDSLRPPKLIDQEANDRLRH